MEGGRNEAELRAHAFLCNHIFRFISSMSLKCTLELDIAAAIRRHGGHISLPDLVSSLRLPPKRVPALQQLMRLMAHSGIFDVVTDETGEEIEEAVSYKLNDMSRLLLHDDDGISDPGVATLRPFAWAMLDRALIDPWHSLSAWFRDGSDVPSPFEQLHNTPFWGMASAEPKFNSLFNHAMECDCDLIFAAVAARQECREVFSNLRSLVDVGGGTGFAAKALADAFPGLECTVLELPHVVAEAVNTDTVKFVEGDMFQFVPPADAVLLKWILHDWGDEDCIKILGKCKEAISNSREGGKVILIDIVLRKNGEEPLYIETQYFFDMLMMVLVSGKERTEIEWSMIFKHAGFSGYKIISTLDARSLVEIYP